MHKAFFLFAILTIARGNMIAQRTPPYQSRWQTKLAVGYNHPLTKLLKGQVTDHLLDFDERTYYWQFLSITHFFHKHWGVEFNFRGSAARTSGKGQEFVNAITNEYSSNFHATVTSGGSYHQFDPVSGDIGAGYLGVIYRLESNRLFLYPKLAIGSLSFKGYWGNAWLKEKNSNNITRLNYSSGRAPKDNVVLLTSVSMGYKISNRIYISVDVSASHYRTHINYWKTLTNAYTGFSTAEDIPYKEDIFTLSGGTGLIIVLNKLASKSPGVPSFKTLR